MEEHLDIAVDALDETRSAIANEDAEEALRCITTAASAMAAIVSAIAAGARITEDDDLDPECDAMPAELWCLLNEDEEQSEDDVE